MNPDNYIDRLKGKSLPQLNKLATEVFNAFIRERDKDEPCISCGTWAANEWHASHFKSAGEFKATRYNEDNVHKSCKKCNYFLNGNLLEYRKYLINKIGIERVEKIELIAEMSKRNPKPIDRLSLIDIIMKYK